MKMFNNRPYVELQSNHRSEIKCGCLTAEGVHVAELKGALKRSVSASQWRPKAGTVLNDVLGAENKGDELDAQMLWNEAQRCC